MSKYLVLIIYLIFISLGLPDSLLGSGWPVMQKEFNVNSSYAGYISMTITGVTIISALFSAQITNILTEKWVMIISIALTVIGLILFSIAKDYWNFFPYAIPYGLGAGTIDASLNNFVAIHYSSRVMNFLHCFYGVGSMISPNVMALALKYKSWNEGYRWTAYIQIGILVICFATIPLWKIEKEDKNKKDENEQKEDENNKKEEKNENEDEKKEDEDNKDNDSKKEIEESKNKIIKIKVSKLDNNEDNNKEIETKEAFSKKLTIEEKEKVIEKNEKNDEKKEKEEIEKVKVISILEALKIKGVIFSCLAFFTYCAGEGTCFLWTSSFFDRTKEGLTKEAIASLSTTIFGGLMLGRFISGLVSEKLGDKKLIRIGLIIEIIGIICVGIPIKTYVLAIIGYCLTSIGMGPIFPSTQHLVPLYFGKEASSTITGLQMSSAYAASTFMPYIFGLIQSKTSMWAHPIYVGVFAILNCIFVEIEFKLCDKNSIKNLEIIKENEENKENNDKKENNVGEMK